MSLNKKVILLIASQNDDAEHKTNALKKAEALAGKYKDVNPERYRFSVERISRTTSISN
jgi:hypothetical protein